MVTTPLSKTVSGMRGMKHMLKDIFFISTCAVIVLPASVTCESKETFTPNTPAGVFSASLSNASDAEKNTGMVAIIARKAMNPVLLMQNLLNTNARCSTGSDACPPWKSPDSSP